MDVEGVMLNFGTGFFQKNLVELSLLAEVSHFCLVVRDLC